MSSTTNPQPELPAGEELVAYLDGELPPDDCRRVEERLATDDEYRQQLRGLDQAWEALDALPSTTADDDFARTTIEMVSVAAERDLTERTANAAVESRRRGRLWAAAAVAAAVSGFAAARALLPDANDRLLADLPVIRQLDLLTQIEDLDFLRRLPDTVPIEQLVNDQTVIERDLAQLKLASAPSLETRRGWIEELTPEQQANLAAQAKRFEALSRSDPRENERLRSLQTQIAAAKDADQLQQTLLAYGQWLAHRTEGDKEELRNLTTDQRLQRVRQFVREEDRQQALRLSDEDAEKLSNEVRIIAEERRPAFREFLRRRNDGGRPRPFEVPPAAVDLVIVGWTLRNNDADGRTFQRLAQLLSPSARQHLEQIGGGRRDPQRMLLWQWMREALLPQRGPANLEKFFADDTSLTNDQREWLLSLPAAEMEAELQRLYLGTQLGPRGAEWLDEFPRNPLAPGFRPDERDRPNGPPREMRRPFRPGPNGPRPGDRRQPPDGPPPDVQFQEPI